MTTIELVSIHIPKTAGTSFRRGLQSIYGQEAILLDNGEYTGMSLAAMPLEPCHRVIHGHVWAGRYMRLLPSVCHVVWLRHPVDWVISLYGFLDSLGPNENPAWKYLKTERPNILDFATSESVLVQAQNKFLTDVSLGNFLFVGLQEHFSEDLADLSRMMQWPSVAPPQENRNLEPELLKLRSDVWADSNLVDALCDRLEDDMRLYEAAIRLRDRRRQSVAA